MAKNKRKVIGSVLKSKDRSKGDYIKIKEDVVLKAGQTLFLESKKQQLENLDSAEASGKLSGDLVDKIRERLEKIPEFVRFEIVMVESQ